MTTTTELKRIKEGAPFTWGEVIKIHSIGDFDIVEYQNEDGRVSYHSYYIGVDTCYSSETLDQALVGCIVHKYSHYTATEYVMRMLGMEKGGLR